MAHHRPGGARDLIITCIKGEGKLLKFWALSNHGLETVKSFENRLRILQEDLDASVGLSLSEQIPIGFKCVVKSKLKPGRWCRAGVLAHQGYHAILVRLLDYGNDEVVLVSDVRNIDDPIMSVQPQAIECILADVMPVHNEWTSEAIKFCEQHLLCNTLSCYVVSEFLKLPVVRVAKKGETEAFVQRLINGGLALIKRETVSPPTVQLSYKMNAIEPNSKHLVRISCFENAQKFYVQLSPVEMELKHMMDSINRLPKDSFNPLKVPAVNTPCLAQLSTNKPIYYRALITYIQQNHCKVFFVDYGFSEQKDIHELRAIPPTFLSLAAQAICCSLPREASIDPEEFQRLVGFEHLELFVISRTSESYIVKLFFHGQDLLMPAPQAAQNYIPQKLNINAKCEVTVSYVNDLSEFYCQLANMKEQQNIISNILNTGYNFLPISLNECIPGKPVCAKFSEDNLWYRAKIVKVNHESDIEVFFVDFGNYDNINLSDVRKIGPDLLKFPIQAFKCFLYKTPIPTDSKVQDDAFDLLEQLTSGQNLLAHVNTFSEDAGYGITLFMRNSQLTVNEKILSLFMSLPVVPVNDVEDVYVTSFDSCKSFFVQFEKIDSEKLATMQEEINSFYSGIQNNMFVPKEGDLVCARFHEDEQYYRARVEKCKDGECDVFFIDYGNRESIPLRDVHPIDAKFTQYPQFGTECAFENFASRISSDKLTEIMLENSFKLNMIRKESEKWYVSPVENFPGNAALLKLVKQLEGSSVSSRHGKFFSLKILTFHII